MDVTSIAEFTHLLNSLLHKKHKKNAANDVGPGAPPL